MHSIAGLDGLLERVGSCRSFFLPEPPAFSHPTAEVENGTAVAAATKIRHVDADVTIGNHMYGRLLFGADDHGGDGNRLRGIHEGCASLTVGVQGAGVDDGPRFAVSNGTVALMAALEALGLGQDDE